MAFDDVPYGELRMLFLDVGNTLISMDFEWIGDELRKRGVRAELAELRRAEAAARPAVSKALASKGSTEGRSLFSFYLSTMLSRLLGDSRRLVELTEELVPVLRGAGRERLWTYVLPGVPEALGSLRELGIGLVAVSNSDGTVESVLARQGLRSHLDGVFDSHIVGYEKPDPRIFFHALERTGASNATTLHVGDLYGADIEGARSAGLHAALVDPYGDWPEADCPRFTDLRSLAETIRARH